jgi:hypothetical protein
MSSTVAITGPWFHCGNTATAFKQTVGKMGRTKIRANYRLFLKHNLILFAYKRTVAYKVCIHIAFTIIGLTTRWR